MMRRGKSVCGGRLETSRVPGLIARIMSPHLVAGVCCWNRTTNVAKDEEEKNMYKDDEYKVSFIQCGF